MERIGCFLLVGAHVIVDLAGSWGGFLILLGRGSKSVQKPRPALTLLCLNKNPSFRKPLVP